MVPVLKPKKTEKADITVARKSAVMKAKMLQTLLDVERQKSASLSKRLAEKGKATLSENKTSIVSDPPSPTHYT